MAFWTENTTEPKRNFRWRVTMSQVGQYNKGGGSIVWWAKTVDTPSYQITETTHSFFDNEFKFPGRVQWQDVKMTLVDPATPNAVQMTNQMIIDSGYSIKGAQEFANNPTSITKVGANKAVGSVLIEIFNGQGEVAEEWTMHNPFITSVSFSTLDYTNDDLRTIDLTWKYDWAACSHLNGDNGDQSQFPQPGQL